MRNEKTLANEVNHLFVITNFIIGLDGLKFANDVEVDENDVNKALELIRSGTLGKGNHFNKELNMALYLEEVEKKTSSKPMSEMFISYANFLVVDGLAKYILCRVTKNGDLDQSVSRLYGEKIRTLNECVRKYGPMNVLEDCVDEYLEIGHTILILVGKKKYGCAC